MQRDYWYSNARTTTLLEDPEAIGREASRRAIERLGARRVPTQRATVVFGTELAHSVIGCIFDAANGDSIYRNAILPQPACSANRSPEKTSPSSTTARSSSITTAKKLAASAPAPSTPKASPPAAPSSSSAASSKATSLNTYTARKLHMQSTGNASRGLAGNPGIGAGNFFLEPGTLTPHEIIADIKSGLFVTETMGHGVNLVTGDYSHGASGLWIENGEFAYPVEEITIAGNLKDMYKNISAIGNDLLFRGASAAPTIRIEGMTIAGA